MKIKKHSFISLIFITIALSLVIFIFYFFIFNNSRYNPKTKVINVYNWGEYICDGSNGSINVNNEFEKITGIKVNYNTFASNEESYARLKNRSANHDVIILSDYMISRMISENMLQPLDLKKIPNFDNIDDKFKNLEFDPQNSYSVPYTWGTIGIIYNKKMVHKQVDSWNILWDEDFAGKILMPSTPRDVFGVALKRLSYSLNTTDKNELLEAANSILEQKKLVQGYFMDEMFNKMESEEAWITTYHSGDAIIMMKENPNLAFCHPKEGTNKFVDSLCIPKDASNIYGAHMYINFMLEPEISLANTKYIGYSTPNKLAFEMLPDEQRNNPIAYPDDTILDKSEVFINLPANINEFIDLEWMRIMSINSIKRKWIMPVLLLLTFLVSIAINIFRKFAKNRRSSL